MNEITPHVQNFIHKTLKDRQITGVLGHPNGALFYTDDSGTVDRNYVWVRGDFTNSEGGFSHYTRIVRCRKVNPLYGTSVILEKSLRDGELEVVEEDPISAMSSMGSHTLNVPSHAWQHAINSPDTLYINALQFLPLLCRPNNTPGLSVYIEKYSYSFGGTNYVWAGGAIDLTALLPTDIGTQVPVVISLDPSTNTLNATVGTVKDTGVTDFHIQSFTEADLTGIITSTDIRIAGVRLYYGQTIITLFDFICDLRPFAGPSGSGGASSLATLSDVTLTTPATNDFLVKSAGNWLNKSVSQVKAILAYALTELSGILGLAHGGTNVNLSATGPGFLKQSTLGSNVSVATLLSGDIPDISSTYVAKSVFNAKGDILGASANDTPAIQSVGANGTTLIADSTQANGLRWGGREVLTAARTYYVDTGGHDTASGRNSGTDATAGAFLTIQKAIDTASGLDNAGFDVTISVASGTYTGANILKTFVGSGQIIIVGDETTPTNVIINPTSANCFSLTQSGKYALRGMKLTTTTSGSGIFAAAPGAIITFQKLNFGTMASGGYQIFVFGSGTIITATGIYTISGNAGFHMYVGAPGSEIVAGVAITLSGTPAFASAFIGVDYQGLALVSGSSFTGSATGKRYQANLNGIIQTAGGGLTFLPGNSSGTTATGGIYV
jgi:hypothetical protein